MASIKFLQDIDIDGNVLLSQAGNAELTLLRTSGAELTLRSQSNLGTLTTNNNFPLHLGTNGGTRMAILTNGNIGVNTTIPSYKFSVSGHIGTTNGNSIYIGGATGDTVIGRLGNTSGVLNLEGDATRSIRLGSATNGEVVRVDNSNLRVGIGTTSPAFKTTIYSDSSTDSFPLVVGQPNSSNEFVGIGLSGFIASNGAVKAGFVLDRKNTYGVGDIHILNNTTTDNSNATLADSKFTILQNGNTGIGTSSPSAKTHIVGSGSYGLIVENGSGTELLKIFNSGTSQFNGFVDIDGTSSGSLNVNISSGSYPIRFSNATSTSDVYLGISGSSNGFKLYVNSADRLEVKADGQIKFNDYTSTTHDGTPTSFLGVDASGNVVKTTSSGVLTPTLQEVTDEGNTTTNAISVGHSNTPAYFIDVQNSTGGTLARFKDSDSTHTGIVIAGDVNGGWVGSDFFTNGIYYQDSIDALRIYSNSAERMRITSTGLVGVGTSSPSVLIDAQGSNTDINAISVGNGTESIRVATYLDDYNELRSTGNVPLLIKTNGNNERMRITSTGAVGIGTTSPSYTLEVDGGTDNTIASFVSTDAGSYISFVDSSTTSGEYVQIGASGNGMVIRTNNSQAITIADTGATRLHSYGSGTFTGTAAYTLAVDSSGNIIETSGGGGSTPTLQEVTTAGNTTTDDVGIQMSNPVSALHIGDGNNTVSSALYSTDIVNVSAQNTAPGFNIISAGTSNFNRGVFKATRSRGTLASPSAAISGDYVFSLLGVVYDGVAGRATAGIEMLADGAVSSSVAPQRIEFQTGTTTSRSTKMTIKSDGDIGINTTSPIAKLHIVGSGSTSATTSLLVENSAGTDLFKLSDNGTLQYNTNTVFYYANSDLHLYLRNAGGTNNSLLFWQDSAGGNDWYFGQTAENSHINVYNYGGALTQMQLNVAGYTAFGDDVKVGSISSPSAKLHIVGSGTTSATTSLLVEDSALADLLKIGDDGSAQLGKYGSGTFTGTAAYTLAVDSSGNIIETSGGGGSTPDLDAVTTAGNTTTNSITIGSATAGTAKVNIVGADATDANDALLVENSSGNDLFKITNSGNFYMSHATRTNSIVINNVDTTGTGIYSTILGYQAADGTNVNGLYLTAIGSRAAQIANGGTYSVAVGMNSARNCQQLGNAVVVGMNAVNGSQGFQSSVAVGRSAGEQSNLIYSTVLGYYSGRALGTTQRSYNTYVGYNVASSSNNQSGNTFIGSNIQNSSTEALNNTVIIGSNNAERLRIDSTGKFKFDSYGAGSFTGTATVNLEADSSGNVIERLEERGTFSGTTDGSGRLNISHSIGVAPTIAMITTDVVSSTTIVTASVISKSSTTVTIITNQASTAISGYYIFSE